MGKFVTNNAMLKCSFGMAPSPLTVIRPLTAVGNMPLANIMDFAPMTNIKPFGMCQSMSNPTVASATAAACGVLTPMPCVPVITGPWSPGGQAKVANFPVLTDSCKCMCAYGGNISITSPGNTSNATAK